MGRQGPGGGRGTLRIDRPAPEIESSGSLVRRVVFAARRLASRFNSVVIVGHDVVNRALLARFAADTIDEPDAIAQRTGCWNKLEHVESKWLATVIDAMPGDGHVP